MARGSHSSRSHAFCAGTRNLQAGPRQPPETEKLTGALSAEQPLLRVSRKSQFLLYNCCLPTLVLDFLSFISFQLFFCPNFFRAWPLLQAVLLVFFVVGVLCCWPPSHFRSLGPTRSDSGFLAAARMAGFRAAGSAALALLGFTLYQSFWSFGAQVVRFPRLPFAARKSSSTPDLSRTPGGFSSGGVQFLLVGIQTTVGGGCSLIMGRVY